MYYSSAAHRFRDWSDGVVGPEDEETRMSMAMERLAQIHRLAFRRETVHVQSQRWKSNHVERQTVFKTGKHNIPTW